MHSKPRSFSFDFNTSSPDLKITSEHVGKYIRRTGPQLRTGDRSYLGEVFLVLSVTYTGMDVRRMSSKYGSEHFRSKYPYGEPMYFSFLDDDYQDGRWEVYEDFTGNPVVDDSIKMLMKLGVTPEQYAEIYKKNK